MQIVIDIDDKQVLSAIKNRALGAENKIDRVIINALYNGTPLQGHGRLIDADELYGDFIDGTEGYDCQTWNRIEIGEVIDDAPTIIEADKGE